jgi:ribonuclease HI
MGPCETRSQRPHQPIKLRRPLPSFSAEPAVGFALIPTMKGFALSRKLLTISDLTDIEARAVSGPLTNDDTQLLIATCRYFLSGTNGGLSLALASSPISEASPPSLIHVNGDTVEIFTDGACEGNPGPGGWGAIVKVGSVQRELSGGEPDTTNNRMEMIGAIEALKLLSEQCKVVLTTDSEYLVKGITLWIDGWKKRSWRTSKKEPVKNQDLWRQLDELSHKHDIEWKWVRGHNGHLENERCDELARNAILTGSGQP